MGASLILAIPLSIILIMLAAYDESHQPPGGGASFETLVAMMMSIPLYVVIFPATYMGIARWLPVMPGARLPPRMHVRVFAGFALGAFALAMVLAYPYSLREPLKTSLESVVLVGILTLQFIVYFELLEQIRVRD